MPVIKGDHLMIRRNGKILRPGNPEFEELEVIEYPVDAGEPKQRVLLLKVKSLGINELADRGYTGL